MTVKKNKQGSLMIGALIMMMVVSATAIAIISRSFQGTTLTTDTKKGYSAYQTSDTSVENFLNKLRKADNTTNSKIPENTPVSDLGCDDAYSCFDYNNQPLNLSAPVADIWNIIGSGVKQGLERNIQLDVSERVESKLTSGSLKVASCNGTTVCIGSNLSFNKCDIEVSFTRPSNDDSNIIENYEVRRSTSKKLTDTTYGWRSFNFFPNATKKFLLKNGDDDLSDQYGKKYYFVVKAKNKKPLSLDSLYFAEGGSENVNDLVSLGSEKCDNSILPGKILSGGCKELPYPHGAVPVTNASSAYNCCNETECLICNSSHHISDDKKSCEENTQIADCSTNKPANTVWNTVFKITQTWNGTSWTPSTNSIYNITPSETRCRYKCAENYTWYGNSCEASTRVYNCNPKPANTEWNTVSEYTQTWSDMAWIPSDDPDTDHTFFPCATECCYKCADGYHWSFWSSICVSN
ncbi:MAG TPA: hypothetical protein DCS28_03210 [Candidatus Moranbacteria bacterium]|nr:hypothetical protein [Candidatus Moranbacteria bacterium]HAT75020.1 hypothetical protein [Candidatus Moranbacteria bacterium]